LLSAFICSGYAIVAGVAGKSIFADTGENALKKLAGICGAAKPGTKITYYSSLLNIIYKCKHNKVKLFLDYPATEERTQQKALSPAGIAGVLRMNCGVDP